MTAEVAIINRLAVALATDSAVTIGAGDNTKIFQSANKLFELSDTKPVGLMVYNNTEFFDVPWEIIVKNFRKKFSHASGRTIFDWPSMFRDYLMKNFASSMEAQDAYLKRMLIDEFRIVRGTYFDRSVQYSFQLARRVSKARQIQLTSQLQDLFNNVVCERIDLCRGWQVASSLAGLDPDHVLQTHYKAFTDARDDVFRPFPLSSKEIDNLAELASAVLMSEMPSEGMTGLVFAGFGDDELFPSLVCEEIDGVVTNRLRHVELERVDIDRSSVTGAIVPFGRREMADRFLYGMDSRCEDAVIQYYLTAATQVGNDVVDEVIKQSGKRNSELKVRVRAAVEQAVLKYRTGAAQQIRDTFSGNYALDVLAGIV